MYLTLINIFLILLLNYEIIVFEIKNEFVKVFRSHIIEKGHKLNR